MKKFREGIKVNGNFMNSSLLSVFVSSLNTKINS